jgi:hypothetical protein
VKALTNKWEKREDREGEEEAVSSCDKVLSGVAVHHFIPRESVMSTLISHILNALLKS